jgi:hypothetical protein
MNLFPRVSLLGIWSTGSFTTKRIGPTMRDVALVNANYPKSEALTTYTTIGPASMSVFVPLDADKASLIWQQEAKTTEALKHYAFKREVVIQTLDPSGSVTGEYLRVSQMVLTDDGQRFEKVISNPKSTLKKLRITAADLEDFSGAQMSSLDPSVYALTVSGSDILAVPDLRRAGGARVFRGRLQVDAEGRVTRLEGITLPEGKERFPRFVAQRAEVSGNLFPSQTTAEDTLRFPKYDVRVRWIVRFSDYRKFRSELTINDEVEGQ